MMDRLLEGAFDVGIGESDFDVVDGEEFLAVRRVVFGDGAVGLGIYFVEQVDEGATGVVLSVVSGLDTKRGVDGDGTLVGGGGPADGIGDEAALVLIRGDEVRLADVGGEIDR